MMVDGKTMQQLKDELESVKGEVTSLREIVTDLQTKTKFLEHIDGEALRAIVAHLRNSRNTEL